MKIAIDVLPYMVTWFQKGGKNEPLKGPIGTGARKEFAKAIETFRHNHILVSLFITPDLNEIKAAKRVGATHIELHTGAYANATSAGARFEELEKLKDAALAANKFGLHVNAGHGLNYQNVSPVAQIELIEELNIGHSIISRATLTGIDSAVRDMIALI